MVLRWRWQPTGATSLHLPFNYAKLRNDAHKIIATIEKECIDMMMMLAYAIATDETTAKAPTIIRCVYTHQSNI